MWIGRPPASVIHFCGDLPVAPMSDASMACTCAGWQSRSGRPSPGSVWYQITETLPALPAAIHGQKTRALPGCATAIGVDQVLPRSFVEVSMIEFAAGVGAPLQPPVVPGWRLSVSQTRYT